MFNIETADDLPNPKAHSELLYVLARNMRDSIEKVESTTEWTAA